MDEPDPTLRLEADRLRIVKYLEGDLSTLREIEDWIAEVIRACYPILLDEEDDLCQAVHEKLLVNLRADRFRFHSSLRTYVARIAHHTAIDRLRRRFREAPLEAAPGSALVDERNPYLDMEWTDERRLHYLAMRRSPERCQTLWRLVFLENLGYEEVARRLGIPPGTVKSRMWHCRKKVVSILKGLRRRIRDL